MTVKEFCEKQYEELFEDNYKSLISVFRTRKNKKAVEEDEEGEKNEELAIQARKFAIKETVREALIRFPDTEPSEIWKYIYLAHVFHRSRETDPQKIKEIIAADQSWKKSSGHAFESMIKEMSNPLLESHSIKVFLQKDLSILINRNQITNQQRDIDYLKKVVKGNIFDLYIGIVEPDDNYKIFGVIQSKTSIRDRVTRDREPSIIAMESFFLSIAIVLDGDFLKMPKFRSMVNGNTEEHKTNGWHAMYVFTNDTKYINDRIFVFNSDMDEFIHHIVKASEYWQSSRQWFTHEWLPTV